MKFLLPPPLFAIVFILVSFFPGKTPHPNSPSPLATYSPEWNAPKYLSCNTAVNAKYMSTAEKNVIYILNLIRIDPQLFVNTVLKKYPDIPFSQASRSSENYKSLMDTLARLKPLVLLYPDSLCYNGARCHALSSGLKGSVGHDRVNEECKKKWHFNAECCDYGHNDPLDIILSLLIDEGVPSLGHRYICLGNYKKIGVSIANHKVYRHNTVLDFYY